MDFFDFFFFYKLYGFNNIIIGITLSRLVRRYDHEIQFIRRNPTAGFGRDNILSSTKKNAGRITVTWRVESAQNARVAGVNSLGREKGLI